MSASFRAFMEGLIDYAGLFPPAALPLEEAVRNFGHYLLSQNAWMLSHFVCPVTKLGTLAEVAGREGSVDRSFSISALATGGTPDNAFLESLRSDGSHLSRFDSLAGRQSRLAALELRLPPLETSSMGISVLFEQIWEILSQNEAFPSRVFFEFDGVAELQDFLNSSSDHLIPPTGGESLIRAGLKLRTGGVTAAAVPGVAQTARILHEVAQRKIPFKATAGLHHPLRHHDPDLGVEVHGFINVFGAGVLARAHSLDAATIEAILVETDARHFRFDDTGFGWRDLGVGVTEMVASRRDHFISFGSCSFEEPLEDLKNLGLLQGEYILPPPA